MPLKARGPVIMNHRVYETLFISEWQQNTKTQNTTHTNTHRKKERDTERKRPNRLHPIMSQPHSDFEAITIYGNVWTRVFDARVICMQYRKAHCEQCNNVLHVLWLYAWLMWLHAILRHTLFLLFFSYLPHADAVFIVLYTLVCDDVRPSVCLVL